MDDRIIDRDEVYLLTWDQDRDGLERVSDAAARALVHRWMADELRRVQLRRLVLERVHAPTGATISDDELLKLLLARLSLGSQLAVFRQVEVRRQNDVIDLGGSSGASEETDEAPASEPEIRPCDFQTVVIKCAHMPGDKRTMTDARFWRDGGMDRDNLPAPTGGRARTRVIEVVGSHVDRGADDISIALEGGPGYTCARTHPKVTIVDSAGEREVFEGQTNVTFKAKCRALPPPRRLIVNPFALVEYYFFPRQALNLYRVDVESCGVLNDGSYGFGRSQHQIRVYPSDTYKLSLSIPALGKTTYERGQARMRDGTVESSEASSTTVTNPITRESSSSSHSETISDQRLQVQDSYSVATRQGALQETTTSTLTASNDLSSQTALTEKDEPVKHVAASFTFERNGSDIKEAASLGELINLIVNLERDIQSVMSFVRDFQPQIGWKFVFELEIFKGELSYEWGYKEWEDHTVFPWWKFDVSMTLFSVLLELRFGVELKVWGFGIGIMVFGNIQFDAKLSASKEATPADSEPWQLAVQSKPTGEIGIRAELGSDSVKAEGKLVTGFNYEGLCKCGPDDPFHIDWKLDFEGIKGVVTGSVRFIGSFEREHTFMQPRKNWKHGRFPGGEPDQRSVRAPRAIVANAN